MLRLHFGRYFLFTCVAGAILAGCGGSRDQAALPGMLPSSLASGATGDLLYVAHGVTKGSNYYGVLSVLTFPGGKPVATIALAGFGTGTCSDASGNVWVIVGHREGKRYEYNAYEYARGGTTPIAKIFVRRSGDQATGCAVDPTTGNLAVLTGFYGAAHIDVWAGAREGKPKRYPINFSPIACAYDASGDLFIDGYVGSTVFFELDELAAGADSAHYVKTSFFQFPGGIQWDGEYLGVLSGTVLYRLTVSGYVAHVAGKVDLAKAASASPVAIADRSIAANSGGYGHILALWNYPAGGKPAKRLARLENGARGLTISARSTEQRRESP
jgi:hypothetical protein